jgi:hypothetical protein
MARMRIIKPGFYQNEVLAAMPHQTRLYFIYLWMLCDRDGKMEFRPKRIKTEIFPYEDADIVEMTRCLHSAGMVRVWCDTWEGEPTEFLEVTKFGKHQHPHKDEKAKGYPSYVSEKTPAWCKHGANIVQAPYQHHISTLGTWNLEQGTGNIDKKEEQTEKSQALAEEQQPLEEPQAPKYAFTGLVVKLKREDLRKWEDKWPRINVIEHLKGIDKTYAERIGTPDEGKNVGWFFSAQSALAKADAQAKSSRVEGEAWV